MCFWNAFLEENKGVHKLVAKAAIRQSLWLEKNNYPEAGLLWASSTTQPPVTGGMHIDTKSTYKKHIIFDQQG